MTSIINSTVPEFKVQAYHNGKFVTVTNEDLKGKWAIFFFYPADFTFVCPTELEDLAEKYEDFKSIGRTVEIADTTLSFFCVPKATTVTSSIFSAVGFNAIFSRVFPLTGTVSVL